jgi:hypothetical protein
MQSGENIARDRQVEQVEVQAQPVDGVCLHDGGDWIESGYIYDRRICMKCGKTLEII